MAWGKQGSTTLCSAGDDLDVTCMTASDFNQFMVHTPIDNASNNINHRYTFDDNGAADYAYGESINGAAKSNFTSQSLIGMNTGNHDDLFDISYVVNLDSEEKLLIGFQVSQGSSGAGTAPSRSKTVGKADTTTNSGQFTRIDLNNSSTGNFDTCSNITVLGSDVTPVATVSAVGANLQVGSRYEETDTRKLYNLVGADTPTFEDDFSGADNWCESPACSQFTVNTSTDRLEFLDDENSTGDRTWYDLGACTVNATQWVLRFKFRFTTLAVGSYYYEFDMGLSDTTVDNNTNQNFMGVRVLPAGIANLWRPRVTDGGSSPRTGASANLTQVYATCTDYFAEIKRTSCSNWSISLSTTNAYDGDLQCSSYTDAASVSDLRYIKIGDAVTNTTVGADMQGFVDDVEFYNGVTSVNTSNSWEAL